MVEVPRRPRTVRAQENLEGQPLEKGHRAGMGKGFFN